MGIVLPEEYCRILCEGVDWERPELANLAVIYKGGDSRAAAMAFVRHLRARQTPRLGYSGEYVTYVRAHAGEHGRRLASERIIEIGRQTLVAGAHSNAFSALSHETLMLGDGDANATIFESVAGHQPRWAEGQWGVFQSVCDMTRALWYVPDCPDELFVALFCWLLTRRTPEWEMARRWRETNLGTSGHNWWIHTFAGFWMAGLFFPELRGMAQFAAFAPEFIERELAILFEDDGWSKEGSPGYHEFAALSLVEMAHVANINGIQISEAAQKRIQVTAEAGWKLWTPDGVTPAFGDCGYSGRQAKDSDAVRKWDNGMLIRRRAARYDLPQMKFVAEALDPDWIPPYGMLPDMGEDLLPAYNKLEAKPPTELDTCLSRSGFYVMRENWTTRSNYVALMAGSLGSIVSSHKHADIFTFELYSKGRRILVDNGYGSSDEVGGSPEKRRWRVGSFAHNVATVDGADVLPVIQEYRYANIVQPLIDSWRGEADFTYFSGVHEGYRTLPEPITATRRKLFSLRGQYYILLDRFTADNAAEHQYQLHFQVNVPGGLQENGRFATSGQGGNLLIVPVEGAGGKAEFGPNPHPMPKYENPSHLTYNVSVNGSYLFATLLVPFEGTTPNVEVRLLPVEADDRTLALHEVTALEIVIDGKRDVYVDQHMEWNLPWRAGGCEGSGRLFHSRCATLR